MVPVVAWGLSAPAMLKKELNKSSPACLSKQLLSRDVLNETEAGYRIRKFDSTCMLGYPGKYPLDEQPILEQETLRLFGSLPQTLSPRISTLFHGCSLAFSFIHLCMGSRLARPGLLFSVSVGWLTPVVRSPLGTGWWLWPCRISAGLGSRTEMLRACYMSVITNQ